MRSHGFGGTLAFFNQFRPTFTSGLKIKLYEFAGNCEKSENMIATEGQLNKLSCQ
jgi:hypothetical protein